jgi:hypothetical protein
MHPDSKAAPLRALVLIPGSMNYFYNQSGRRIADALGELSIEADVTTLDACPQVGYDLCVLSNISEILYSGGDFGQRMARIIDVRARCRAMLSLSIDCVSTEWYHRIRDYSARAGASLICDLGLFDQSPFLEPQHRAGYRLVFSGLTPTEARIFEALDEDDAGRTIPWAFVGSSTPHRVALIDHLVQTVDPRGFVYMPPVSLCTEKGSPHLNQQQFERVLERTRYQIWCSGHSFFYMETERFRTSLLTGGVPIKIIESRSRLPESIPLDYLMIEWAELGERLAGHNYAQLRRRFREDWRRFPMLHEGLASILREVGINAGNYASRAA